MLIEPTLLGLLQQRERDAITALFQAVIDRGKRDGNRAALLGTLEWIGGQAWAKLDEATKQSRLEALSPLAYIVVPHAQGLLSLKVTEQGVSDLNLPTLLIYGTASFDPHPAIRDRWRALRPDLEMVIAEGAGHNVHRDKADVVNAAIDGFLRAKRGTCL